MTQSPFHQPEDAGQTVWPLVPSPDVGPDDSPGEGVGDVSCEGSYDWQGLTGRPALMRRLAFRLEAFCQLLARNWQEDCIDQNARFLWVGVFMGFGAAIYYGLPDEPSFAVLLAAATGLCVWAFMRARKGVVTFPLLLATSVVVGLCAACGHGQFATTPVLENDLSGEITGRLERVEQRGTAERPQERWTIAVEAINKLEPDETPHKLLLVRRAMGETYRVGERLKMVALLTPLQRPAYPGGFDYGRYLWARAIGGQGYLSRSITRLPDKRDGALATFGQTLKDGIERTRQRVASYIDHRIDGKAGGLAAALAVGKRDFLLEDVETALRRSGLAHILAISGLHMALVTMTVFWGVRGFLALWPFLALRYPIKQWAAGAALLSAVAYLVLSGSSVATIRAFCMTAIFLVAILAKRSAMTMQNLALVLILLIFMQPYGVVEAGMQMSFAATAALIASYDRLTRFRSRRADADHGPGSAHGLMTGGIITVGRWISGIGLTSLIASIAVLPFSVAHFQQMAPYGLVTNLLAMPLVSLLVMPMGLVTVLLTPFGLQSWPLKLVEWGLDWVIAIAEMTSSWSSADYLVVKAGGNFLPLVVLGLAVYTIHRRLLSALAAIPMLLALALWWYSPMPDVWISESGTRIAMRDESGAWQLTDGRKMTLDFNALLRADGDTRALGGSASVAGISACDKDACVVPSLYTSRGKSTPLSLAIVKKPDAFDEECQRRDIIVSRLPIPQSCIGPALMLGDAALAEAGARFLSFKAVDSGDTKSCRGAAGGDHLGLKCGQNADVFHNGDDQLWTLKEMTALPKGKRPWMPQS